MARAGSVADEIGGHIQRRGYTLERLAKESGVSKATIHRWMRGNVKRPYYWENVLKVADTLNLNRIETNLLLQSMKIATLDSLWSGATPEQRILFSRWSTHSRNNLPGTLTSFIGRDDEILDVASLLARDDVRLVTLTGPGGVGKTRLAVQVAEELHDVYPDGLFFVPLAGVTDPETIVPVIARTLDLRDVPGQSTGSRLADYVRQRRILLVLDNVEHLVEAAQGVVSLLEGARYLTVLVTSRVPLHVSCEHTWPLAQLDVPDPSAPADALHANPAVRLFVDRAAAVNPALSVHDESLAAAAEICVRLEGSPLAIELAAARCRQFDPREILLRFPNRLDLGADGPRDRPGRQQSLRSAIEWSDALLLPEARTLFRKLSVFSGGWHEQAALDVTGSAADIHGNLLDANLIYRQGSGRYGMLETIREYALERLESDCETASCRNAHAAYYRDLAANRLPYIPFNQQAAWMDRVDVEQDNFRAALEWSATSDQPDILMNLAGSLWPYWHDYGHFHEGLRWIEQAMAAASDATPDVLGSILTGAQLLTCSISDVSCARAFGDRALETWQEIGDWHGVALVQTYRAHVEYTTSGDAAGFARAGDICQQALEAWERTGQPLGIAHGLVELSILSTLTGQFEQAVELVSRSRAIYEQHHNTAGVARTTMDFGLLLMLQQDLPNAIAELEESIRLCREQGTHVLLPWGLFYLGTSYCFSGELDRAREPLEESLHIHHDNGTLYGMSYTLLGFAALHFRRGLLGESARLCGAVVALLERTGIAMNPAVQQIYLSESQMVRRSLGDAEFERAFASGLQMTVDESVALVLQPVPSVPS